MPAVAAIPIIIDLVAPALATAIGEAILPSAIASTSIIGTSTTVASVVGGAIIGSGTAAVSAVLLLTAAPRSNCVTASVGHPSPRPRQLPVAQWPVLIAEQSEVSELLRLSAWAQCTGTIRI